MRRVSPHAVETLVHAWHAVGPCVACRAPWPCIRGGNGGGLGASTCMTCGIAWEDPRHAVAWAGESMAWIDRSHGLDRRKPWLGSTEAMGRGDHSWGGVDP